MKYGIIYADPPWEYKDKAAAGKRGASFKYKTLPLGEICSFDVQSISTDDSALFLWSTMPMVPNALKVINAWGFTFKTVAFTWVKTNKIANTLFWGMGKWTRSNPEICLLGVRGKPKRMSAGVHSVIMSPVLKHSQKPPVARDRIVQLCGDLPRIELFARENITGWDTFGDETENTIILKQKIWT